MIYSNMMAVFAWILKSERVDAISLTAHEKRTFCNIFTVHEPQFKCQKRMQVFRLPMYEWFKLFHYNYMLILNCVTLKSNQTDWQINLRICQNNFNISQSKSEEKKKPFTGQSLRIKKASCLGISEIALKKHRILEDQYSMFLQSNFGHLKVALKNRILEDRINVFIEQFWTFIIHRQAFLIRLLFEEMSSAVW